MKRIIITGATSMTGVALVCSIIHNEDVDKIYLVVRGDTPKWNRIPYDTRIVRIDCSLSDYHRLPAMIPEACDCFYHLAWTRTDTYEESAQDMITKCNNMAGVIAAVDAARRLRCRKFVWAGSQAEYGIAVGKIKPDTPCNPVRADGIIHLAAGKMARILAEKSDMVFIWMRIFSIYGKYDRDNSLISSTIRKLQNGEHCSFTPSEQLWDYLNAEDLGRAFYLAGKKVEKSKVYCVGSGEEHPLRYYIDIIRELVAPNAELGIGELPYPEKPIMRLCADITALNEDTGWKPEISFRNGIKALLE